eukprot:7238850-Prymnesium_polylepis.1
MHQSQTTPKTKRGRRSPASVHTRITVRPSVDPYRERLTGFLTHAPPTPPPAPAATPRSVASPLTAPHRG